MTLPEGTTRMSLRTHLTRVAAATAAALALASAGAAYADTTVFDGDAVQNATQSSIDFGNVACGATVTKTAAVKITRKGDTKDEDTNNPNVFANGAVVSISTATVGAGLSAGSGSITLGSTWVTSNNNTDSEVATITVRLTSSTAGAGSGSVTFTATGTAARSASQTVTQSATLPATWTTGTCSLPTTTTVTCPAPQTYTGSALTPCTAVATGANSFSAVVPVTYSNNVNAGTATASATFGGSGIYQGSTGTTSFTIDRASSSVTVTCSDVTYSGSAQTPCSATAGGAGITTPVSVTPVTYANNVDHGTATASATWLGDANHVGSTGNSSFLIAKAGTTTTISCPSNAVYDGSEHPCTGTTTGAGSLVATPSIAYSPNSTDAGPVSATATYGGDPNHTGSSASATYSIGQAGSTVTVTCTESSIVYDGNAHTPCSARVTGAGGLDQAVAVSYTDNTNAGTVTASAAYAGDGNHEGSEGSATFEITAAPTSVVVDCAPGSFTYTGDPLEVCTATATGPGLDMSLTPSYSDNVVVGTATASASYGGDRNHAAAGGGASFEITKAASSLGVSCTDATYTGSELKTCTATLSGPGTLDTTTNAVVVTYSANVNVGLATGTATWAGDDNHNGTSGSGTFAIGKASSSVTGSCDDVTYTGAAQTPCTGSVHGAGTLVLTGTNAPSWAYSNNVNAGTGHATLTWDGDDNHFGSDSGDLTFTIAKAASTTTVTCPTGVVYDGAAHECTAVVSAVALPDQAATVSYTGSNVNAGTVTASASWTGDDNHTGSSDTKSLNIAKAGSTTTVTCPTSVDFTGSPLTPCSAVATGAGSLSVPVSVVYTNNTLAGTATATATYGGDTNHLGSTGSNTFTINAWTLKGFYQPVDMGNVLNTVKAGSTVPLKFEVFAGATELTSTSAVASFTATKINCNTSIEDAIETFSTTGGTSLRYDSTAGQFVQNWQTPKLAGNCYKVTMTTLDGSSLTASFKLK